MKERICRHCGKIFYSQNASIRYCSDECKFYENHELMKCCNCGKDFYAKKIDIKYYKNGKKKGLYCSVDCANESFKNSVTKTCAVCGKEYTVCNSFKDIQKYCSQECFHKSQIKYNDVNCPVCGKIFHPKSNETKYCSNECSSKAQQKRITCNCEVCGKEFERIESEYKKNKHHYCSFDCKVASTKWDEHDLNILRKNYRIIKPKEIQKMLNKHRSAQAIRDKAQAIGLGKSRLWSKEEEQVIKDYYEKIPINEVMKKLPNRNMCSILHKAQEFNLLSFFYLNNIYSDEEIDFLKQNYLKMTDEELSKVLKRTPYAIHQKLYLLGLTRPIEIKKGGYNDLNAFVRSKLYFWKNDVRKYYNYTCCLSGAKSNVIIHHIYGFNLLMEETINILHFEIRDSLEDYTDEELLLFFNKFLEIQEIHNAYCCVTESIHKLFHSKYGYGNNTPEQWEEFCKDYKENKYRNIA